MSKEINPMRKGYHDEECSVIQFEELSTYKMVKVERVRFVTCSFSPFIDLSYFHVRINGKRFSVVDTPFYQLRKKNFKKELYNILKKQNVYFKDFFDPFILSILY